MKKTYMQPTLQVVHVNVTKLIAWSDPSRDVSLDPTGSVDAGSVEVKGRTLSNKSVWDEEW